MKMRKDERKERGISSRDEKYQRTKRKYHLRETSPSENSSGNQVGGARSKIHCRCHVESDGCSKGHYLGVQSHHALTRERRRTSRLQRQKRRERHKKPVRRRNRTSEELEASVHGASHADDVERSEFRRHMRKAQEITAKSNVDYGKIDPKCKPSASADYPKSDSKPAAIITENRLTRQLGIYKQGKKSTNILRDSIVIPEAVQAKTEEGLKRILNIEPSGKSQSSSAWSCKIDDKSSVQSSCSNPVLLSDLGLHKTPPLSSKITQRNDTVSEKSCDLSGGTVMLSGVKELPKSPVRVLHAELAESLDLEKYFPGHEDYLTKVYHDLKEIILRNNPPGDVDEPSLKEVNISSATRKKHPVRRRLEDEFKKVGKSSHDYLKRCMKNNVPIFQVLVSLGKHRTGEQQDPPGHVTHRQNTSEAEDVKELSSMEIFRRACGLSRNQKMEAITGQRDQPKIPEQKKNNTLCDHRVGEKTSKPTGNHIVTDNIACHHGDGRCCYGNVTHHHGYSGCCARDAAHHLEDGRCKDCVDTSRHVSVGVQRDSVIADVTGHCGQAVCRHLCSIASKLADESSNRHSNTDTRKQAPETPEIHSEQSHKRDVIAPSHKDEQRDPSHRYTTAKSDGNLKDVRVSTRHSLQNYAAGLENNKLNDADSSCHRGQETNQSHVRCSDRLDHCDQSKRCVHGDQLHSALSAAAVSSYRELHGGLSRTTCTTSGHKEKRNGGGDVIVSHSKRYRSDPTRSHREDYSHSESNPRHVKTFDKLQHKKHLKNGVPAGDERERRNKDEDSTRRGQQRGVLPLQHDARQIEPTMRYQDTQRFDKTVQPKHQEKYLPHSNLRYHKFHDTSDGSGDARRLRYTLGQTGYFDYSKYDSDQLLIKTRMHHQQQLPYHKYPNISGMGQQVSNLRLDDVPGGHYVQTQSVSKPGRSVHTLIGEGVGTHHSADAPRSKIEGKYDKSRRELKYTCGRAKSPSRTLGPTIPSNKKHHAGRETVKQSVMKRDKSGKQAGREISCEMTKDELMDVMMDGLQFIRQAEEMEKIWAEKQEEEKNEPDAQSDRRTQSQVGEGRMAGDGTRGGRDGKREVYEQNNRRNKEDGINPCARDDMYYETGEFKNKRRITCQETGWDDRRTRSGIDQVTSQDAIWDQQKKDQPTKDTSRWDQHNRLGRRGRRELLPTHQTERRDYSRQSESSHQNRQHGQKITHANSPSSPRPQSSPGLQFPYPQIFWKSRYSRHRALRGSSGSEDEDNIPSWYMDLALQPPLPTFSKTPKLYPQKMF